jgi:DNA-binding Xre family transcriptional regulator
MAREGLAPPELTDQLARQGVSLSHSQAYRLVAEPPRRIAFALLAGLCAALRCSPADLCRLRSDPSASAGDARETALLPPEFRVPGR